MGLNQRESVEGSEGPGGPQELFRGLNGLRITGPASELRHIQGVIQIASDDRRTIGRFDAAIDDTVREANDVWRKAAAADV